MASEEFPKLKVGQYAVIHGEVATGIITLPDGRRHVRDDTLADSFSEVEEWASRRGVWLVFDSLAQAKEYALNKINEMPEIECEIYDHNHQKVERFKNQEYVDAFVAQSKRAQFERRSKWHNKILGKVSKWF